jgi:branched-chain amino acid transport system permease protein
VLIFLSYLMVVLGLQLFTGNSGVISFGHVGFMAIGGYTAMLMNLSASSKAGQIGSAPGFIRDAHFSYLPATLIAIVVTCLVALPFGFVFARLSGTAAAIATLAFYIIVITVIANWDTVTHGTFTLYGLETVSNESLFWWMIGWAAIAILLARLFRDSGLGLSLRATSSDELVARAVGVNLPVARLAAWLISAGVAAVGGALYMKFLGSLAPTTFSFNPVVIVTLVMFIVGGRSVSGVIVGATLIAFIDEVLKRIENDLGRPGLEVIGLAVIFTLMMIFRSEGLFGRWELDELGVRWWRSRRRSKSVVKEGGPPQKTAGV